MKNAYDIRKMAWTALAENGQYLRYVAAYILLMLTITMAVVVLVLLGAFGAGTSGIAPFLAPGGQPEAGLLQDPAVMLPLLVTALVISVAIIYPIGFGAWSQTAMSMAAMRRGFKVGHAFSGWGHGWKMGWIEMVKGTYLLLWFLLLLVPGWVKWCSYAMTEFLAVDHPDWTANQCITESRRMMNGHKWRFLCLNLSFIGWFLLVVVASMMPMVGNLAQWFLMPYFDSAKAAFYEDLLDRADRLQPGAAEAMAGGGEVKDYAELLDGRTVV